MSKTSKKECIAMLLAGGQGTRLGVLTANVAKPAVPFGAKYRIIDFPLSNSINSGIEIGRASCRERCKSKWSSRWWGGL